MASVLNEGSRIGEEGWREGNAEGLDRESGEVRDEQTTVGRTRRNNGG